MGVMGKWGSSSTAAGPEGAAIAPSASGTGKFNSWGMLEPIAHLEHHWSGVGMWQCPQGECSTEECPCLSLPFAAGERQAVVSLWAPQCHLHVPLSHQALEGTGAVCWLLLAPGSVGRCRVCP